MSHTGEIICCRYLKLDDVHLVFVVHVDQLQPRLQKSWDAVLSMHKIRTWSFANKLCLLTTVLWSDPEPSYCLQLSVCHEWLANNHIFCFIYVFQRPQHFSLRLFVRLSTYAPLFWLDWITALQLLILLPSVGWFVHKTFLNLMRGQRLYRLYMFAEEKNGTKTTLIWR